MSAKQNEAGVPVCKGHHSLLWSISHPAQKPPREHPQQQVRIYPGSPRDRCTAGMWDSTKRGRQQQGGFLVFMSLWVSQVLRASRDCEMILHWYVTAGSCPTGPPTQHCSYLISLSYNITALIRGWLVLIREGQMLPALLPTFSLLFAVRKHLRCSFMPLCALQQF